MKAKIEIIQIQKKIDNKIRDQYVIENVRENFREDINEEYFINGEFTKRLWVKNVFVFWLSKENNTSIPIVISRSFIKNKDIEKTNEIINLRLTLDLTEEYVFIENIEGFCLIRKSDYPKELGNNILVKS